MEKMENVLTNEQILNKMELFMTQYHDYNVLDGEDELILEEYKERMKENLVEIHNDLFEDNRIMKVHNKLPQFADRHIQMSCDMKNVINAFDILFNNLLIEHYLDRKINVNGFCTSLVSVILVKITLAQKYVDENDEDLPSAEEKKEFLTEILKSNIELLSNIYKKISVISEMNDEKHIIMELLCAYDLEDIYSSDIVYEMSKH